MATCRGNMANQIGGKMIKVLMAKPGLDGHDRGAKVVSQALRDAGMEVIYTGLHQTADMIVNAALQEDVDVIGLSILSGAHLTLVPKIISKLKEAGLSERAVFVGGIIPPADAEKLKQIGAKAVFGPGTPTKEIIEFIKDNVKVDINS